MEEYKGKVAANKGVSFLTPEEREEIAIGLGRGEGMSAIALRIGRNKSTISREVRRNGSCIRGSYCGVQAQRRAQKRWRESHRRERISDARVREYIERKMKEEAWTPERIAGRLPLDISGTGISHETIYLWLDAERRDLIEHLVFGHKERRKRSNTHSSRKGRIPNRIDIEARPAACATREEAGHWEADTVVSRQSKAAIAVFVERQSRFYIAVKMKNKTAKEMLRATIIALGNLPKAMLKTITFDNGLENALHEKINARLGTMSFFWKRKIATGKGGGRFILSAKRRTANNEGLLSA